MMLGIGLGTTARRGASGPNFLTLPRYLLDGTLTVFEPFEAADWTTVQGTIEQQSAQHSQGTYGLKLSTGTHNQPSAYRPTGGVSIAAFASSYWLLHVYAHDSACVGKTITVFLGNATSMNPGLFQNSSNILELGWNTVVLKPGISGSGGFWTPIGGGSFSTTINYVRVGYNGNASGQNVTVDNLVTGVVPIPVAIFGGDGGASGQYATLFTKMQAAGLRGSIGLDTNGLDTAGYMTTAQAQEMIAAGWSFNSMGPTHQNLVTVSAGGQAAVEAEISEGIADLAALGVADPDQHMFWHPNGAWNDITQAALAAQNIVLARHALPTGHNWPWPADLLKSHYIYPISSTAGGTPAATVNAAIDTAQAALQTIFMQIHQIDHDGVTNTWSATHCQGVVDHLVANQIPCLTTKDFYDVQSGPIEIEVPW